jgi:VIT1/CCC1 family predicted Fe2+/Mn2+ transporter
MAEQHPLTSEPAAASPDWATLTERALDDLSRIVRSEIHMLQTSIETAVEARIDRVVTRAMTIAAMVCGAFCILCAVILLLHQWLLWWQSLGIAGFSLFAFGAVNHATRKASRQLN